MHVPESRSCGVAIARDYGTGVPACHGHLARGQCGKTRKCRTAAEGISIWWVSTTRYERSGCYLLIRRAGYIAAIRLLCTYQVDEDKAGSNAHGYWLHVQDLLIRWLQVIDGVEFYLLYVRL